MEYHNHYSTAMYNSTNVTAACQFLCGKTYNVNIIRMKCYQTCAIELVPKVSAAPNYFTLMVFLNPVCQITLRLGFGHCNLSIIATEIKTATIQGSRRKSPNLWDGVGTCK